MENMKLYNLARSVPDEAKKAINAGRLKGMTDINPMFRIKRLTEMFGACGIGWWYEITDKRIIDDELTKQRAAFVDIMLYFVDPETGVPSNGIPGTGGSSFVAQESKGAYLSDECFKMALTDALSVACKAIGIAADVYYAKDRTKYTAQTDDAPQTPEERRAEIEKSRQGAQNATTGKARVERKPVQSETQEDPRSLPATEEQRKYIETYSSDEDYARIMERYGAELETMSQYAAQKVILQIKANNARAAGVA